MARAPLRVLFVEDREQDLELLVLELRRGGFDVAHERVETPEAFVAALDGQGWDLILCDYTLPHFSAPAALALVKEKQVDLPFIVLSGAVSEEAAVEVLRAGAHDFMVKGKLSRLLPAIDRELRDAESRAERKKTQELLIDAARAYDALQRASAARLLLMFENVPVILYTHAVEESGHFRFTSVNPAFLTATGLTEDAVVGHLVDEIIPESSLSLVLGRYRDAIRERAAVRWITTTFPGGTKVAEVTITPIFDDAGRCTELFGTVYDLTDIQQIKEELRASEEQKEQLAVLNRKLAEATRAKSEFLANMSHELRTPLNAILGFSDLLLEQLGAGLSEQHARYLRNIGDAGRHLLELINDVLDLSKVEAGRIDMRKQTIDLGALLEPVVAAARTAADDIEITFSVEAPEDLSVQLDPARIRQVLYNLLSNAVKFTDAHGSVTLRVSAVGDVLAMDVTDTGIGIPASSRSRVFGTFERLHEGRAATTGTGLGLALTKRLVELHGGTIDFDSEEGKGTTFRVRLFGAVAEVVRGARVLVVDDENRDSDLICAAAAESGLRCEVVTTAEAALAAVRREHPRAIVLDLRLPDARGERVLETLKSDPATRRIPIIVVTVEDDDGRTRPLGADDHITKPIDRARLASWLRTIAAAERST